jgi:class 3 adenylate cyclase
MPGIDGMQTLAQIKGDPLLAAIPVIMISALDELPSVVRCIELGAEEYMPKTVDPVLLRARLGATLEKKALRDRERLHLAQLEAEKRRADELLRVILPEEIIQELQATDRVNPRLYPDVAVLFCDVVGFTPYCASRPPGEVIAHLQELIERYELIAQRHGVQKIKTVGDAFVATAGLLSAVNEPVLRCVRCGLEMVAEARRISAGWDVRVGIHRGPVVAGVVGRLQFQFDLWGDTVNTAARVESSGAVGAVNLSESAWQVVARRCSGRSLGTVELRGKGAVELFRVDEVLA